MAHRQHPMPDAAVEALARWLVDWHAKREPDRTFTAEDRKTGKILAVSRRPFEPPSRPALDEATDVGIDPTFLT